MAKDYYKKAIINISVTVPQLTAIARQDKKLVLLPHDEVDLKEVL